MWSVQAAAALCIKVGGLMDPESVPGLAHYLEHSKLICYWSCFPVASVHYSIPRHRNRGESSLRSPAASLTNYIHQWTCLLAFPVEWNITFRLVVCVRPTPANLLSVPRDRTCLGHRSFTVAAPAIWNTLHLNIRNFPSICCFRRHLKTFFYNLVFRLS